MALAVEAAERRIGPVEAEFPLQPFDFLHRCDDRALSYGGFRVVERDRRFGAQRPAPPAQQSGLPAAIGPHRAGQRQARCRSNDGQGAAP